MSSKHCITIMISCMLHFALHEWIPASWNPFVAPHTKKTKVLQIRQHNNEHMCQLALGHVLKTLHHNHDQLYASLAENWHLSLHPKAHTP